MLSEEGLPSRAKPWEGELKPKSCIGMEHINSSVGPGALETIGQVFHSNMDNCYAVEGLRGLDSE